ncbi:MAG: DUF2125 domain-containing protein [Alphaproteobacteria bacterium]|nr:DUF2125 domain-containing protein [Alphaproteobacteria bacterium]
MTLHRWLSAVGALLLALAAATIVYWFVATDRLRAGLDQWAAQRLAEGYVVSYGQPLVGGFPFNIRVVVADPQIAAPDSAWSWRGTALQIETRLWNLRVVTFQLPGRHEFAHTSFAQPIVARADPAGGWATIGHDGRVIEATLDCTRLEIDFGQRLGQATAGRAELWVRPRLRRDAPDEPLPPLEVAVTLREVTLPTSLEGPLGRQMPLLATSISIAGKLPQAINRAALAQWRDQSGTVELLDAKLRWGPLNLKGSGTVTIDEDMRPLGAATVELRGFNETVQRLVEAGAVKKQAGTMAQLVLGVLAKPATSGGEPVLSVPLTAQDGFLSLGPIKLLPVLPLALD